MKAAGADFDGRAGSKRRASHWPRRGGCSPTFRSSGSAIASRVLRSKTAFRRRCARRGAERSGRGRSLEDSQRPRALGRLRRRSCSSDPALPYRREIKLRLARADEASASNTSGSRGRKSPSRRRAPARVPRARHRSTGRAKVRGEPRCRTRAWRVSPGPDRAPRCVDRRSVSELQPKLAPLASRSFHSRGLWIAVAARPCAPEC